jgi:hypothetical protein
LIGNWLADDDKKLLLKGAGRGGPRRGAGTGVRGGCSSRLQILNHPLFVTSIQKSKTFLTGQSVRTTLISYWLRFVLTAQLIGQLQLSAAKASSFWACLNQTNKRYIIMNKIKLRFIGTYFQKDVEIELRESTTVREILEAAKQQYASGPVTFDYFPSSFKNRDIGAVMVKFDQSPRAERRAGPVSINLLEQKVTKGNTVFQYYIERDILVDGRIYRVRLNKDNIFTPIDSLPKNDEWRLQDGDYVVFRLVTIGDLIAADTSQLS